MSKDAHFKQMSVFGFHRSSSHVNDGTNMRVLRVTYRIISQKALSQVAALRGICDGYNQNHPIWQTGTRRAVSYQMVDITYNHLLIAADDCNRWIRKKGRTPNAPIVRARVQSFCCKTW